MSIPIARKGFTLIELLVVIAIIAVLAAILFPVFARAREKARQTTCSSNQRQIATVVQMYAQDHDETLPNSATFWKDVNFDAGILICPTAGKTIPNGYCANGTVCGLTLGKITDPASKALTFDGLTTSADPSNNNKVPNIATWVTDYDFRHTNQLIASYVDGHIEVKSGSWSAPTYISGTFTDRLNPLFVQNFEDGVVPSGVSWNPGGSGGTGTITVVQENPSNKVLQFKTNDANFGYGGGWDLRFGGSYDCNNNAFAQRVMNICNSDPSKVRPVTTLCTFRIKMVSETINNAGQPGNLQFGPYIGMYRQIGGNWEFPEYITQTYSGMLPTYSWWTSSRTNGTWVKVDYTLHSQVNDPIMKCLIKPNAPTSYNYTRLDYSWVMTGYYRSDTVWLDDVTLGEIQPG